MEEKLRGGLMATNCSKRAAPTTPPPLWRIGPSSFSAVVERPEVSVRKLCADLWETERFQPPIGLRRSQRRESDGGSWVLDHHQPPSRSSLRKQKAATFESKDDNNSHPLQSLSSPSCSSNSLEVMLQKPTFSQTNSSRSKSSSSNLENPTKLLKVLNRLWNLEKQNGANISLVKALKMELDECRAEIKEVQRDSEVSNRRNKKKMEQEDLRKQLDDERKIRKQSEKLQWKLSKELSEIKHCFAKSLKDLEKERKSRIVLENLCDEFAKTVKERETGKKSMVNDKVIVQIAEAWYDQRLKMKLEGDKERGLSKLSQGIEAFLRGKEKIRCYKDSVECCSDQSESESDSDHQNVQLTEVEEGLDGNGTSIARYRTNRGRRDNRLQILRGLIGPESSLRDVDESCGSKSHEKCRKTETLTLQDKLMEARLDSQRLRSLQTSVGR